MHKIFQRKNVSQLLMFVKTFKITQEMETTMSYILKYPHCKWS